jgi:hypothetical protein
MLYFIMLSPIIVYTLSVFSRKYNIHFTKAHAKIAIIICIILIVISIYVTIKENNNYYLPMKTARYFIYQ